MIHHHNLHNCSLNILLLITLCNLSIGFLFTPDISLIKSFCVTSSKTRESDLLPRQRNSLIRSTSYHEIEKITDSRIVAIGDIHGDLNALFRSLKIAGVIEEDGAWCGENTIVIQMGDLIDRGPDDLAVLQTIYSLDQEAQHEGGRVISLLGNHEVLNLQGEFAFVDGNAFSHFDKLYPELDAAVGGDWSAFSHFQEHERCRAAALMPGGLLSSILAQHPVVLKVGTTLFVHGGLLPHHALKYSLEEINELVAGWILGEHPVPDCISKRNSPVWSRSFSCPESSELDEEVEDNLDLVLQLTQCDRMVVGHTPQKRGINSAARGKVWRVDTGTSAFYGGSAEVLEMNGNEVVSILTEQGSIPSAERACENLKEQELVPSLPLTEQSRLLKV
mmetsp:Transcript_27116/g.35550  ORF Transcript_27116/g.35550 Transcript_27116/m.35550 type:complete len:390 (-) Transcript_27116:663-1832(-)